MFQLSIIYSVFFVFFKEKKCQIIFKNGGRGSFSIRKNLADFLGYFSGKMADNFQNRAGGRGSTPTWKKFIQIGVGVCFPYGFGFGFMAFIHQLPLSTNQFGFTLLISSSFSQLLFQKLKFVNFLLHIVLAVEAGLQQIIHPSRLPIIGFAIYQH